MRITNSQTVARPAYFDRNAVPTNVGANTGSVGPHAETVRASYTVPAGKKSWLSVAWMYAQRQTAAAPAGLWWSGVKYTPSGGTARYVGEAISVDNTVAGQPIDRTLLSFELMSAGDKYELVTGDLSTGGSVAYQLTGKHTEFDA